MSLLSTERYMLTTLSKGRVQVLVILFTPISTFIVTAALLLNIVTNSSFAYADAADISNNSSQPPTAKYQKQQHKQQQAQQNQLRKDIKSVEESLLKIQKNKSNKIQQLKLSEIHISKLSKLILRTNTNLQQQASRLESMQKSKMALELQVNHYRQQLALQLRSSHALGKREYIKILLSAQNPADISRMLTYLDYLNQQQIQLIQHAKLAFVEFKNTETTIVKRQKTLAALKSQQQDDLDKLTLSKQNRKRLINKLGQNISNKKQTLQTLKKEQFALNQLMNQFLPQSVNIPAFTPPKTARIPFKNLKGKLKQPTIGKIIRKFGQKHIGNIRSKGLVFAAPIDKPVFAVAAGQVVFSDWLRGFGMLMIIDHGNQYMTLYGQNTSLHYEPGDWVQANEIIASTGDSGGTAKSGLYFELRHKGKPLNPAKWLKR